MLVDVALVVQLDVPKHLEEGGRSSVYKGFVRSSDVSIVTVTSLVAGQYLHSDDGVYEEEHGDEETHVREGLLGERGGRASTSRLVSEIRDYVFIRLHVSV